MTIARGLAADATSEPDDRSFLARLLQWTPGRGMTGGIFAVVLILAAIIVGGLTYFALTGAAPLARSRTAIYLLFFANLSIVLALVALIAWQVVKLHISRRVGFAGVKLHTRLVTLFSIIAAIPAITVAVFSAFFLFLGFESWFTARQSAIIGNAEAVAEAYLREHQNALRADVVTVARVLDQNAGLYSSDPVWLSQVLLMQAISRELNGAYILSRDGTRIGHAELPNVSYTPPPEEMMREAELGQPQTFADYDANQVYCLVKFNNYPDYFLYATRPVDPLVLGHLREARTARSEIELAQNNRNLLQLYFFLSYLTVALLVLLAAVRLGVWAANRLVGPIGRLIGAAERVSEGDLAVRVNVGPSDDEIGSLGRAFNRMTAQLETQRSELVEANRQLDRRRRFTEAVLSGVTAGVLGLDSQLRLTLANRSALTLLDATQEDLIGHRIEEAVPELAALVRGAITSAEGFGHAQIDLTRGGRQRHLTVRVSRETSAGESRSVVVTFDDITNLVAAQRMSAWADVARRIAHEIKNPLTPIQLSAERLRRKYRAAVADPEIFDQCTQTIIRQVADIGRMADEFSSFARMPTPAMAQEDLGELVREAVFLQRVAHPDITFEFAGMNSPCPLVCDRRLVTQALINILKNAAEAIQTRRDKEGDPTLKGVITLHLNPSSDHVDLDVVDNGCGLPADKRHQLTEPYMTTRAKGTGLGLAIVKKVMEDHAGSLMLEDAPSPDDGEAQHAGALVRLRFPTQKRTLEQDNEAKEPALHGA